VNDLLLRPATELAELIRSNEITASELVDSSLRRIDELEPEINAFTYVAHDSATEAAAKCGAGDPRPFAGVPIAIKDNRPVAGMRITLCSDLFGDLVPPHDSFLVRRLKEAGFVIVGKTALPEMGILPTTESRRFGPTRNPWSLDRTPGGSSGGSGAAVAAGMVPLAHGNDGGGSIRIPAACCGLVGLKAARGRVSVGPEGGDSFLVADGVLSHTVAETAALLDVLAGYEPGDATWAPPPERPFAELATRDPGRLRVGLALNPPLTEVEIDPACAGAARSAAAELESLGHSVQEVTPPWGEGDLLSEFTRVWAPLISMQTMVGSMLRGRAPTPEDVEPLTWVMWENAHSADALDYVAAEARMKTLARSILTYLDQFDLVVTPALARRPVPIGEIHGLGPEPWDHYRRSAQFTPFTAMCNVTGLPAVSLPLYQGEDGLPLGVHLIGRPVGEGQLLAVSAQLEQALPWADRRPILAAA
jgi:amidase